VKYERPEFWADLFVMRAGRPRVQPPERAAPIVVRPELLRCALPVKSSAADFEWPAQARADAAPLRTIPDEARARLLGVVKNFRILREGIATIDFQSEVDVVAVDFRQDVVIDVGIVDIYRNKRRIPAEGSGLNTQAVICMEQIFPVARGAADFEYRLREFCRTRNADFVFYLGNRGIFQFVVPNFRRVYDVRDLFAVTE
jgi:hypothetical protein